MNPMHDAYDHNSFHYISISIYYIVERFVTRAVHHREGSRTKEMSMSAQGPTTVWGTPRGVTRTRDAKGWYQQLRASWAAHKAARQQATREALHRGWDATREAVTPSRADAALDMAAAHGARSVTTLLYGLAV
jgi:hypothetical protein